MLAQPQAGKERPLKAFGAAALRVIAATGYFYLRAGPKHRFIPVWVVVVDGRVLVRSWNDTRGGWYRAFRKEPVGAARIGSREVAVRARAVRGAKLVAAMDVAYAEKYVTKANLKYVKGFATAKRRATTLELVPA